MNTQSSSFLILKPKLSKIWDKKAKVEANIAREIIYLQLIHEDSWKREQAYENRKLVKAGKRESCKQRKRRLRKEYLASKNK